MGVCLLRHAESLVAVGRCYLWIYFDDVRGISTRQGSPDRNTQHGPVAEVTMRMQICPCGPTILSSFINLSSPTCKLSAFEFTYLIRNRYVMYVLAQVIGSSLLPNTRSHAALSQIIPHSLHWGGRGIRTQLLGKTVQL